MRKNPERIHAALMCTKQSRILGMYNQYTQAPTASCTAFFPGTPIHRANGPHCLQHCSAVFITASRIRHSAALPPQPTLGMISRSPSLTALQLRAAMSPQETHHWGFSRGSITSLLLLLMPRRMGLS